MAGELSKLFVTIGANTKEFQKGMQTVQKNMQQVGKNISSVGISMTKWVTGSIAAVGGGMLAIAQKTANAGDEIQKMSLRTGISTEALSEYKHAAELSGTSLESLEKGVKRMQSTIYDAEKGLSTATDALEDLGVTSEELAGKSPEEQFEILSSALADVDDASRKAALAQDIFGRAGTEMLPMLAAGSEGIAKMRQEAQDLGIVFDQEAADSAAKFNDDIDRLKKGFAGVFQELGMKLIPIFVDELMPVIRDNLIPLIKNLVDNIIKLINWFSDLNPTWKKIIGIAVGFAAAIGPILFVVGKLITVFSTLAPLITGIGTILGALFTGAAAPFVIAAAVIVGAVILWRNFGDDITEFVKKMVKNVVGFIDKLKNSFVKVFEGIKDNTVGVFESMWKGIKQIINWIISGVNSMISGLNKISIDIPDWVPGMGGKSFGFNIGKIPMLAEGGNINWGGYAVVGDDGPELLDLQKGARVTPLSNSSSGTKEITMTVNQHITDKATADYANNDLMRKLQGRGLAGAYR